MHRQVTIVSAVAVLLSGCASTGMQSLTAQPPAPTAPPESFSYQTSRDGSVEVAVNRVILAGDPEFIPQHPNWMQVHVTVKNVGRGTVKLQSIKAKLQDGTVVASASSPQELVKTPNMAAGMVKTVGIGTAGMVAGMFIAPILAPIGGAVIVARQYGSAGRMKNTMEKAIQSGLRAETIAPGTAIAGYVYVPALKGQTGLIAFYEAGAQVRTLEVRRTL